ncbi:hypothetical protein FRX31_005484 [Thalictrum thalictroides]|uniref:Uncharacterized protein n=1 Tax=Thalictrum thalictroides TaxID=46969 RepID=A0A7J6X5F6_THATH|nr:hypothetical protein FRX31_005484 [Thalictrum thalictroides]
MKFQHYFSIDTPLIPEMKKVISENIKVSEVAKASSSAARNVTQQKGISSNNNNNTVSNEIERRTTSDGEDPIRIVMFLESWSHT